MWPLRVLPVATGSAVKLGLNDRPSMVADNMSDLLARRSRHDVVLGELDFMRQSRWKAKISLTHNGDGKSRGRFQRGDSTLTLHHFYRNEDDNYQTCSRRNRLEIRQTSYDGPSELTEL
jgi:hypothetical protein